jgi:N6-L-threonylcarbamoyladenine synthase
LADICASFQDAIVDVLVAKTIRAAKEKRVTDVALAGGVSANSRLRNRMSVECESRGLKLFYPKLEYCMDNGAMIAYVGYLKLRQGHTSPLETSAIANLELV